MHGPGGWGNGRWAIANQRTALAPLLADSVASYKQATEQTLGKIAADLLSDAEGSIRAIGVFGLLSGSLEQRLDEVGPSPFY